MKRFALHLRIRCSAVPDGTALYLATKRYFYYAVHSGTYAAGHMAVQSYYYLPGCYMVAGLSRPGVGN